MKEAAHGVMQHSFATLDMTGHVGQILRKTSKYLRHDVQPEIYIYIANILAIELTGKFASFTIILLLSQEYLYCKIVAHHIQWRPSERLC